MIIYKITNQDSFTKVPTQAMRNTTLSLKAKGLLCILLGHADGYEITEKQLIEASSDGRSAVLAALKELEAQGYVQREQQREESGRLGKSLLRVSFSPATPDSKNSGEQEEEPNPLSEKPLSEKPLSEKPSSGKPSSENLTTVLYIPEDQKKEDQQDLNRAPNPPARAGAGAIYISTDFEEGENHQENRQEQRREHQKILVKDKANYQKTQQESTNRNRPAPDTPSFPLTQDEEDEFYRLAIAYKLTNDKKLDLGNAAAIASAAITRLKKGCSRPDDRLLLTLYQEGLLGKNSETRDIQSKMRQKQMMDALNGL